MAKNVILYPNKSNVGKTDQAQGIYVPENLVPIMLKNGYQTTPNINNPKVAESLVLKAQTQIANASAELDKTRDELEKRAREIQAREDAVALAEKNGTIQTSKPKV